MVTTDIAPLDEEIDYPTSDGRPMAETEWHFWNMVWFVQTISRWIRDDPQAYVGANMFVYYEKGNRHRSVVPDVYFVRGVPKRRRRYYKVWEEGKSPELIVEFTSRSTQEEDEEDKFELYQDVLAVAEYVLFDPHAEYLDPPLKGYRLVNGLYKRIEMVDGRLPSRVLGLHFERADWVLRLYNPGTSQWLPIPEEEIEQAKQEATEARAQREAMERALKEADTEIERLRRELESLRRLSADD